MKRNMSHGTRSRRLSLCVLAGVLVLGLAACYPGGPESLDELSLVVTIKNPEVSFAALVTYAMEDTVVVLGGSDSSQPLDRQFDLTILAALHDNMEARGFVRELDPESNKPDVWLSVGGVEATVWVQWYSWGYWGGYYPGGGYYPPATGVASFQQGTVAWQMLDLRAVQLPITEDTQAPVMWIAGINGALKQSDADTHDRITVGFGKAFEQSPYVIAAPPTKASGQEVE